MIAVIQCAGTKQPHAGRLARNDGTQVKFIAHPNAARPKADLIYARPDDRSDRGVSWREVILEYNKTPADNPLKLLPAWQLYRNDVYARLARELGVGNVYILSAGWGLIAAKFLTPDYDITFSNTKKEDKYKQRRKNDRYQDFHMLPDETRESVVFFGGKDYLPLFAALTKSIKGKRTVFYNSQDIPEVPGCTLRLFETDANTNWHYLCANALLDGEIAID
jgi:hypothetical protein